MQADHSGDQAMYRRNVTHGGILHRRVAVPKSAHLLLEELARYPDTRWERQPLRELIATVAQRWRRPSLLCRRPSLTRPLEISGKRATSIA